MEPRRISSKSLADMIEQIINNYNNLTNLEKMHVLKYLAILQPIDILIKLLKFTTAY